MVIFENSVSGVIPVAVDKINMMAELGSPRLEVNEVSFAGFLQQWLHFKLNNYTLIKNKPIYHARKTLAIHLYTNPSMINRFIFGQWVVIYYLFVWMH